MTFFKSFAYNGAFLKAINDKQDRSHDIAAGRGLSTRRSGMDGLLRSLIMTVRRRVRDDEELTVEAVTKELGYTRQYVSGRFHRITGRLLSHFLKEKRLAKAARLLKNGNMRVSQIARRCGFDSENYFRQQFRERFGMSPRQFRANGRLRSTRRMAPAAVATA
jgi:AraC-like DNA-binding protein